MEDNKYAKVVARAWKDEDFKNKLLNNPKEALLEYGITVPENEEIEVIAEKPHHHVFVLPASPAKAHEMSERELGEVFAAGNSKSTFCLFGRYQQCGDSHSEGC
jgi:hypothetical protein